MVGLVLGKQASKKDRFGGADGISFSRRLHEIVALATLRQSASLSLPCLGEIAGFGQNH